ncbi:MAG: sigma 54-interacting transcriptional regulator [Polyangiaceae bacterium]|nr:sigma 54-interacting transcriptional regulator [Polyangiaceae bacterium]
MPPSVHFEVVSGAARGSVFELPAESALIGRAPHADLVLPDAHVSSEHARVLRNGDAVILQDLRSTNGTAVRRGEERLELREHNGWRVELANGDRVELGGIGDESTVLSVVLPEAPDTTHVIDVRPLRDLPTDLVSAQRNGEVLRTLARVQHRIGIAPDLDGVVAVVADAALELVPRATHATVVLRDDNGDAATPAYLPVITRVRGPDGGAAAPESPVPITRSVFRRVVAQRAAVLAADAPAESFSSESLLGASIRSTIGIPLWRGEEILGVLQVDNRDVPAMFDPNDVDVLSVLSHNASLAVDNSRLIRRLVAAEQRLERENSYLRSRERSRRGQIDIIGESRAMRALLAQLDKVVDTRVTVLIEGETGVGKELIAAAVHYRSRRRDRLFVAQNCAAMPENLLESALFGHRRGAFTGATEDKRGLFDVADGGTLFLDEVAELPLPLQAKLLRALQEGEIRPLGATTVKYVDVRIVAATNRNLEKEVEAGRFREDLFYRLKVFPLHVPPLRERRDDVPRLANHFLDRYTREIGKPVAALTQETLEILAAYDWPGNVRELENEIQRLVIQAEVDGLVTPNLVSAKVRKLKDVFQRGTTPKGTLREMVEHVEKLFILESLREHGNSKTAAAKALGITREGLHKKLRQLGIG